MNRKLLSASNIFMDIADIIVSSSKSKALIMESLSIGSWNSSALKSIWTIGGSNLVPSAIGYLRIKLPVAIFLTITSIGIISNFLATITLVSGKSINCVLIPFSSNTLKSLVEISAL